MTDPKIFVVIPPQSSEFVPLILKAGGIPVIDLEAGECGPLPEGAWVRIGTKNMPDGAAGIIHTRAQDALPGVPNWLESSELSLIHI